MKKVLYISNTSVGSFNRTLSALQERVDIDLSVIYRWESGYVQGYLEKLFNRIKIPLDRGGVNRAVRSDEACYDYVIIPKGNFIYPSTIKCIKKRLPKAVIISWSLDDMYAWHNRSVYYTLSLPLYDFVVTTKSFNVSELVLIGAKDVFYLNQPYSKQYHKPMLSKHSKFKHKVLFIGHAEDARFQSMLLLAENGIKVNIYGPGWASKKYRDKHSNLVIHERQLIGTDYAEAISNSTVTLCFLRKLNRDLHTSRSVEIPACNGFMIAERTSEHLEIFEENEEAVYFSDDNELLEKVSYYLGNEVERVNIQQSGYQRCISSGYSYDDMFDKIFSKAEAYIK